MKTRPVSVMTATLAISLCGAAALLAADPKPNAWTPELMLKAKGVGEVNVSSDGKRVAFAVSTPVMDGEKSEWLSQIYVAASDGRHSVQLTRGDKSATNPAWSPDGHWIVFLTPRAGPKSNLWRIRVDGGEAEQLTDEKGGLTAFQWSPDGSQIAYLMTDPKTDAEEKADREKRDAFVVNESQKRSRMYVIPVNANAEGKRPVRRLTGGDLHVGGLLGAGTSTGRPMERGSLSEGAGPAAIPRSMPYR